MSETNKTPEEEVKFPLNQRLLEEAIKIKQEREILKERLKKIEAGRDEVSTTVHEKVKSDYIQQLNDNTTALLEKKQDIDRELSTLYEAKKKVEGNVSTHQEELEEIKFRNKLGEYKKEAFSKASEEQNTKLGKFKKILAAIESNIEKYESLFEGEEELGGEVDIFEEEAPPPPPPPTEDTKKTAVKTPVSVKEDEYEVGTTGEGYFGPDTEEVPLTGDEPVDTTSKEIDPTKLKRGKPRLTVIEGDNKGEKFKLGDETTIGRASSNTITLKEAKVSRQHSTIKKRGNEYLIEDLHSSNGVYVNDEKIKEHVLADGDLIRIGDFALKFQY